MIVFHLAITTCASYLEKHTPLRDAHHAQLDAWRATGIVIGAGLAPDGRMVDLVCRFAQPRQLEDLWRENAFVKAGLWTAYTSRSFREFVEPWELPPLGTSRRATILEGRTSEHDMAQFALIELRGAGRLAFGGFFEHGETWALMKTADAAEARGWLETTGFWATDSLRARPLEYPL